MKFGRKIFTFIFFLLLGLTNVHWTVTPNSTPVEPVGSRSTIIINASGGGDYTHIQWAIDNATEGDIVYVNTGLYHENIRISKPISLICPVSENVTIDGGARESTLLINSDWVNVSGFNIKNSSYSIGGHAGIKMDNCRFCKVENNFVSSNNNYGISFSKSSNNTILNNFVTNNDNSGITLDDSHNNTISNNVCNYNKWGGIDISTSDDNSIINNTILQNNIAGIFLSVSLNDVFINNSMFDNGFYITGRTSEQYTTHSIDASNTVNGKPVFFCKNTSFGDIPRDNGQIILGNCSNLIVDNHTISNCSAGISIGFSSNITVSNNTFLKNIFGIRVEDSSDVYIMNNSCHENIWGIYLRDSVNNTIENNTCNINVGEDYSSGIYITRSHNNILKNNICSKNEIGISIDFSDSNTLLKNYIFSNNQYGIEISYSSETNKLFNNTIQDNYKAGLYCKANENIITNNSFTSNRYDGIVCMGDGNSFFNNICDSNNNTGIVCYGDSNTIFNNSCHTNQYNGITSKGDSNLILNNRCTFNNYHGIELDWVKNNYLTNNSLIGNGVFFNGDEPAYWHSNSVDNSNTANGKAIIVWKNITDGIIPPDVGQVILINCKNVTIEHQNISDTSIPIILAFSDQNRIINNICEFNKFRGISLYFSNQNIITDNLCISNNEEGILITCSKYNSVLSNKCTSNKKSGISLKGESGNNIIKNNICNLNYEFGINISDSNSNVIDNNSCCKNKRGGIYNIYSDYSQILNNTCYLNNEYGINVTCSDGLNVVNNTCSNNLYGIIVYRFSYENDFSRNFVIDNIDCAIIFNLRTKDNNIYHNDFINNNREKIDVIDNGVDNIWYDQLSGNHWSDWIWPDLNNNGIVDIPYLINGSAHTYDYFPLTHPINPTLPIADGGHNIVIEENSPVKLNALNSYDDKGIINYSWSFIYNETEIVLYGITTQFIFNKSGNYTIILTVIDNNGNLAEDRFNISVIPNNENDDEGNDTHNGDIAKSGWKKITYLLIGIGVLIILLILVVFLKYKKRKRGDVIEEEFGRTDLKDCSIVKGEDKDDDTQRKNE